MTSATRTFVESLCVLAAALLIVILGSWRYTLYWPKVWGAKTAVNGVPSPTSTLYLDSGRKCGGVLLRRTDDRQEVYAVGFGTCQNWRFAWRCVDNGVSFLPVLAFSNHEQFAQGCMSGNIAGADANGKPLSEPKLSVARDLKIERRLIEFTADDGKRVSIEW